MQEGETFDKLSNLEGLWRSTSTTLHEFLLRNLNFCCLSIINIMYSVENSTDGCVHADHDRVQEIVTRHRERHLVTTAMLYASGNRFTVS